MRPDEYEKLVAKYFENKGFKTEISSYTNDYGVDVFAIKGKTKIAIQAKMFGNSSRPINRQMVMELHGAKDYFDCTKAFIATNGRILDTVSEVAKKLKIQIIEVPAVKITPKTTQKRKKSEDNFESIWENYVMPLGGKKINRSNGSTNEILQVDPRYYLMNTQI